MTAPSSRPASSATNPDDAHPRDYDLVVLGAGSAGFSAAITAAELGARVALVGHGQIGGTCVNVGCVPSKTMIRAGEALHGTRAAARFPGLTGTARVTDWAQLVAAKDALVATLQRKKYVEVLAQYERIDYLPGAARFDGEQLRLDGAAVHTDRIVIATGASPAMPEIPGIASVPTLTSTSALELETLPRSLLVLGAGYVGCELAQMFARAGTTITLVTRSGLLRAAEPEIAHALMGYLRDEGIDVRTGLAVRGVTRTATGIALSVAADGKYERLLADQILLATGRTPNTAGMNLPGAGIELTPHGAIVVDAQMRTTRPGTYAAGDVTGRDPFVYMAAYGARIAARNALDGDTLRYDNSSMPWVVFTDPQLAGVGLSEQQAHAAGRHVKTSVVALEHVPRALVARDTRGLIKLIADADTDRLLGGQILAPEGGDSIQTLALAMQQEMTASALADTIFPYLTTVEGLKLAAQSFSKDVTKLSCCAG